MDLPNPVGTAETQKHHAHNKNKNCFELLLLQRYSYKAGGSTMAWPWQILAA